MYSSLYLNPMACKLVPFIYVPNIFPQEKENYVCLIWKSLHKEIQLTLS